MAKPYLGGWFYMKKIAVFLLLFCLALMPAQAEVMDEAQAYTP